MSAEEEAEAAQLAAMPAAGGSPTDGIGSLRIA
jgi:hypothetical protein